MNRRLLLGLVSLAVVTVAVLGMAATYRPSRQYDPYAQSAPPEVRSAAQVVEESLVRAGHLPTPGAELELRSGAFQWLGLSPSAPRVSQARARSVRLSAGARLLWSVLDDDPTCIATVETTVVTADGQEVALTVVLWDYALLMPWSIQPRGDGWKPFQVRWP